MIGNLDIMGADVSISASAAAATVWSTGAVLANFSYSQPPGSGEPHSIFFVDASYEPEPVSWAWTFGDGGTSGLQNPVYAYAAPGEYTVSLTIAGSGGSSTFTQLITVT
jgi:PKD repeat protein